MGKDGLTRDGRYRMTLGSRIRYGRTATGIRNWRHRLDAHRGRRDLAARAGDQIWSRIPFYRNRLSSGTGRPHRMDREYGRGIDRSLGRRRDSRVKEEARPSYYGRAKGGESDVLRRHDGPQLAAREPRSVLRRETPSRQERYPR
jgi:hypothetical protein